MTRLDQRVSKLEVGRPPVRANYDLSALGDEDLRFIASLTFDREDLVDLSALSPEDLDQLERIMTKSEANPPSTAQDDP